MIMAKWLVHVIVYYWIYHIKWDVDQQWILVILGECSGIYDLYNKPSWWYNDGIVAYNGNIRGI